MEFLNFDKHIALRTSVLGTKSCTLSGVIL